MAEEIAAGYKAGSRGGSLIGNGADALLSEGSSSTGSGSSTSGTGNQSSPGQTVANSRATHDKAADEIANSFTEQGANVQREVTMDSTTQGGATVRARADQVLSGAPNGSLQVPSGYVATDLNGNVLQSIPLNSAGQVIVEVKTGGGELTPNQAVTYPAAQVGNAAGAGRNAAGANMQGQISPTQVVIIRPKP